MQAAGQPLALGFADVEQPHKRVIASEIDGTGPTGTLAGRMDVLRKIEPQQSGDLPLAARLAIGDGPPWDRQFADPRAFIHPRGIADARALERRPRIDCRARIALALNPQPRRRL